jgi:RNA-directed DNA polymerase
MTISLGSEGLTEDILFPQIAAWDNLWLAYHKAAKGKRGKAAAATFEFKLADNLIQLQQELADGSYRPGPYSHFTIHEPKQRKISAAPFRDRVVHHALCNIIEPRFEALFHPHSYANRVGMGTHSAVNQLQTWSCQYRYVLRLDIVKHFPSIDHAILKQTLFKTVKEPHLQQLIHVILASGEGVLRDEYEMVYFQGDGLFAIDRPRGLPIGNLTSQFWSNCYLNPLDWFISRQLGCPAYLRYVDDLALFSNSKQQINGWKQAIIERLAQFRLTIHAKQAQARPCSAGIPWLGFVIYPTHRRLKRRNVVNFKRRLKRNLTAFAQGDITFAELDASVQGWINHVRYADTWGLRESIFQKNPVKT